MNYKKLFGLTIVVALLFTIAPVYAWTYPDCTDDSKYEKFGPRLDRIYIGLYATQEAEWEDLKLGKIDMTDWPLNRAYLDELSLNPDVKVAYYGPELGFDAVDINCDNGPYKVALSDPDHEDYPNPVYQTNPCGFVQDGNEPYKNSSAEFRKALWRTLNRDYIVANIWMGLGDPMYTVCTTAQGLYLHPNATVPVEAGGIMWSFDLVKAAKILDDAGFIDTDSPKDGWRNFPVSLGGDGKNINLIYYGRSDDKLRNDIAVAHEGWIESIGVQVDLRLRDRSITYPAVMIEKNFHLYTAGWSIGRDADSGMGLYYSGYYWHPGFCYNYGRVNCTEFDAHFEALEQANTNEEVIAWAWKCQYDYNMKALGTIPAVCNSGYKAYSKTYTGGNDGVKPVGDGEDDYRGQLWKQIVNLGSYGVDNYWTFLNAYPEGHLMGDGSHMTMRYGFKTALLEKPSNPCYAEWLWDWNILGLTYESLLYRDPYTYTWMPWLCKDFTVITWVDPEDGQTKSGVRFTLRSDVYWSDGTPLTAADIEYSLVEMDDELINLGFGAPWWYSNTVYIKSFYIIDPCNVEVLLDIKSYFAVGWIGGCIILPKHIWKTLIDAEKAVPGTVNFWGAYVDPDVIGTGPYKFKEYDPIAPGHALLVANSPGRVVTTTWPGSTAKTSTHGFFNYCPVEINVKTADYLQRVPPDSDVTLNITLHNKWIDPIPNTAGAPPFGDLIVTKTIQLYWYNSTSGSYELIDTKIVTPITLHPCVPESEPYTFHVTRCHYKVVVSVHVDGPPKVEVSKEGSVILVDNPWVCQTIVYPYIVYATIKEDISGSTYYDDVGYSGYPYKTQVPTPDCKVDMINDIRTAAKSFGSYPGHPRWTSIADINDDYKVDMINDIRLIAKKFGW